MSTCQGALDSTLRLNPSHWTLTVVCESDIHGSLLWLRALSSGGYAGRSRAPPDTHLNTHAGYTAPKTAFGRRRSRGIPCVNTGGEMMPRTERLSRGEDYLEKWIGANYDCSVVLCRYLPQELSAWGACRARTGGRWLGWGVLRRLDAKRQKKKNM